MDNKNDKNHFFDPEMQSIWKHFVSHFRNQNSAASYQSDTIEFLEFTEKSFLETTASDVENYYAIQQKKINESESGIPCSRQTAGRRCLPDNLR